MKQKIAKEDFEELARQFTRETGEKIELVDAMWRELDKQGVDMSLFARRRKTPDAL